MDKNQAMSRKKLMMELVNEVTKDDFDVAVVKTLMLQLEIPYSEDPIDCLNNILKNMHGIEGKGEIDAR